MASVYSDNLGIEQIGSGEQNNTWGDTVNTNMDLLDHAISGNVTVTLPAAGSSGTPNDLPVTDGTTSNGRYKDIIFDDGGDLGATAFVQLTPNNSARVIYVTNSLSGSQDLSIHQGTYNSGRALVIPAGTTAVVRIEGAGATSTVTGRIVISSFAATILDDASAGDARTTLGLGALAVLATVSNTEIDDEAVTVAKMQHIATDSFLGRDTAATGDVEVLTAALARGILNVADGATADQTITLTGDVTGTGTGSFAATIADEAVTLAKMAHMATASLLGRNTASTGDVEVLSAATAKALLSLDTTDSVTFLDVTDTLGELRQLPSPDAEKTGSYSLDTGDVGVQVKVGSGGSITIPNSTFAEDDIVTVRNKSGGDVTITCSITTCDLNGADVATATLADDKVMVIVFDSGTACTLYGDGVT